MVNGLSVVHLREHLVMRSSSVLSVEPGERGLKGVLLRVEALELQDPEPLGNSLQPWRVSKGTKKLAVARLLLIGALSSQHV